MTLLIHRISTNLMMIFGKNAQRVVPENYLQIEHEILEWFKGQGQDYHAQINKVLRAHIEAHR